MSCLPARGRHARRGFTLVELLVVVAVVALLIGLLLPALSRARVAARQTITLARLRDLGIGAMAYASDYKDHLPTLADPEEKAFLGLSLMARQNETPAEAFVNSNTADSPSTATTPDGRPVLADVAGAPINPADAIGSADIPRIGWHCSFSYDNDIKPHKVPRPVVYLGDRADYAAGRTISANWGGAGMCLLWTDQHAVFVKSRTIPEQGDPNIYHHNEFAGEGADEVRDGVSVTKNTLDTHLRFFSEEEDDTLLPDSP